MRGSPRWPALVWVDAYRKVSSVSKSAWSGEMMAAEPCTMMASSFSRNRVRLTAGRFMTWRVRGGGDGEEVDLAWESNEPIGAMPGSPLDVTVASTTLC